MFKVSLMLADAAQVAEAKLNVLGAGWSHIVPGGPFSVCGIITIPWDKGMDWHHLRLELVDGDGDAVCVPQEQNGEPKPFVVDFPPYRATIGPMVKPGSSLSWPFALNLPPGLPLEPGAIYEWRITIDGKAEDGWMLPFTVIAPPEMPKAA